MNINAYWKSFVHQTAVRIQFVESIVQLKKKFYRFSVYKSSFKENFPSNKFRLVNSIDTIDEKWLSWKIPTFNTTRQLVKFKSHLFIRIFHLNSRRMFIVFISMIVVWIHFESLLMVRILFNIIWRRISNDFSSIKRMECVLIDTIYIGKKISN